MIPLIAKERVSTPLIQAAIDNAQDKLAVLVGSAEQEELDSALHAAAEMLSIESASLLIERGANPNATFSAWPGNLPAYHGLSMALVNAQYSSLAPQELRSRLQQLTAILLDAGLEPNQRDSSRADKNPGPSALELACNHLLEGVVARLLQNGADPNYGSEDERCELPLYETFTRGSDHQLMARICRLLLDQNANPDVLCHTWKRSPLMMAVRAGATEACRVLLSFGADANLKNPKGENAFDFAASAGNTEICQLLGEYGVELSAKQALRAKWTIAHRKEDWQSIAGMAEELQATFADEADIYLSLSAALSHLGTPQAALQVAMDGLERAFGDQLMTRALVELLTAGQPKDAKKLWSRYKSRLVPGNTDPFTIANMLVAFDQLGEQKAGLEELGPWILANTSSRDEGLLHFNLACLQATLPDLEPALRSMYTSIQNGRNPDSFDKDASLQPLHSHAAYEWIKHSKQTRLRKLQVFRDQRCATIIELLLDENELTRRTYRTEESVSSEVETKEYEDPISAMLDFVQQTAALEETHLLEQPMALRYWPAQFEAILKSFRKWQNQAPDRPALGAIVVEWDFGESPGEHNLQFGAYTYQGAEAEETFSNYVYSDEMLVDDFMSGPPIDRHEDFAEIARQASLSETFSQLRVKFPFYWAFQEHDSGHISVFQHCGAE